MANRVARLRWEFPWEVDWAKGGKDDEVKNYSTTRCKVTYRQRASGICRRAQRM